MDPSLPETPLPAFVGLGFCPAGRHPPLHTLLEVLGRGGGVCPVSGTGQAAGPGETWRMRVRAPGPSCLGAPRTLPRHLAANTDAFRLTGHCPRRPHVLRGALRSARPACPRPRSSFALRPLEAAGKAAWREPASQRIRRRWSCAVGPGAGRPGSTCEGEGLGRQVGAGEDWACSRRGTGFLHRDPPWAVPGAPPSSQRPTQPCPGTCRDGGAEVGRKSPCMVLWGHFPAAVPWGLVPWVGAAFRAVTSKPNAPEGLVPVPAGSHPVTVGKVSLKTKSAHKGRQDPNHPCEVDLQPGLDWVKSLAQIWTF